ncbi:MAG: hypothetical protein LAP40_19305 [Acidobacteriia bacterium]|nr:hypothetical protein [Terriglobia bacterium]
MPRTGIALVVLVMAVPLEAQWLRFPTPGIPRTADGKPNLAAPAPRTQDGKPDLSGVWQPKAGYISNIGQDLKPEDIPLQPWAAALYRQRRANESKDDPTGHCIPGGVPRADAVPYPFKIVPAPGMMLILYEAVLSFRQIFLDGRALPKDPNPTWMGYSVGHWDGDSLVVETTGFNDQGWLDNDGHPATDAERVTERFRRRDYGHLDIEITIDDAKAYTRPWTVTLPLTLLPEGELIEYICSENNKDVEHLVGK